MSIPKILVITGPTASGKTSLSIDLAKKFNGEIISADSRQVYRNLDIGTAKITPEETEGILHHLIDIRNPDERYSAVEWKHDAESLIAEIHSRDNLPMVVGGSGFYIKLLLENIELPDVAPNHELRKNLAKFTTGELLDKLEKASPRRAKEIDPHNKRRIIRALEIAEELGEVPPIRQGEPKFDPLILAIKRSDEELKRRIKKRLEEDIERGLVDEVRRVRAKYSLSDKRMDELGLEYSIIKNYLNESLSREKMIESLIDSLWQYATRQKTWFRNQMNLTWLDPDVSGEQALKLVENF